MMELYNLKSISEDSYSDNEQLLPPIYPPPPPQIILLLYLYG